MSGAKPKEASDLVTSWIRSAMEINKFLEPGNDIAEIMEKGLVCVEARIDEADSSWGRLVASRGLRSEV